MTKQDKLVDIECEIRREDDFKIAIATGATQMYKPKKGGKEFESEIWFWLWRSQIEINDDGTVTMPEKLAFEKGLI